MTKPIDDFNYVTSAKDGYASICKPCRARRQREYAGTFEGFVVMLHKSQRANSRGRGHPAPTYNAKELANWFISHPKFFDMWDEWDLGNRQKHMKPSVDRIDNTKGYSFDNIQLTTWQENLMNKCKDVKDGKYMVQNERKVVQYTIAGKKIQEHYSISSAERETGISASNIVSCCNDSNKSAGSFKWAYLENTEVFEEPSEKVTEWV